MKDPRRDYSENDTKEISYDFLSPYAITTKLWLVQDNAPLMRHKLLVYLKYRLKSREISKRFRGSSYSAEEIIELIEKQIQIAELSRRLDVRNLFNKELSPKEVTMHLFEIIIIGEELGSKFLELESSIHFLANQFVNRLYNLGKLKSDLNEDERMDLLAFITYSLKYSANIIVSLHQARGIESTFQVIPPNNSPASDKITSEDHPDSLDDGMEQ